MGVLRGPWFIREFFLGFKESRLDYAWLKRGG